MNVPVIALAPSEAIMAATFATSATSGSRLSKVALLKLARHSSNVTPVAWACSLNVSRRSRVPALRARGDPRHVVSGDLPGARAEVSTEEARRVARGSRGEHARRRGEVVATAKEVGLFDEAIRLAKQTPCDPKTLTRAARDFADVRPEFAIEAGRAGQVRDRIRALVASETDGERFVTRTLSRTLGL